MGEKPGIRKERSLYPPVLLTPEGPGFIRTGFTLLYGVIPWAILLFSRPLIGNYIIAKKDLFYI